MLTVPTLPKGPGDSGAPSSSEQSFLPEFRARGQLEAPGIVALLQVQSREFYLNSGPGGQPRTPGIVALL